MSVIEFHPDDLLDRELDGTLSDADRLRLAAHLQRCAVCRLERQLRFDFEQELGPRQPASDLPPVVSAALRAAGVKPPFAPPQVGSAAPSMRRWVAAGLVACALLGTGVAAAQLGLTEVMREWLGGAPARDAQPAPRAAGRMPAQEQRATLAEASRPREQDVARSTGHDQGSSAPRHDAPGAEPVQHASESAVQPVAPPRASGRGNTSAAATATTLFERAGLARRSGAAEDACALYRELQTRFPRSPEARLSLALLARLQLDRGQLGAALQGFESYLATAHRALREEAMVGRARTLERLGRERDAEHAWRDLLEAYPQSAAAATARRRVGQSTP